MSENKAAYDAGRDSVVNKPNLQNCHYGHFATPALKDEWERGRNEALAEKQNPPPGKVDVPMFYE